ncbi:hypothetical protein ACQPXB_46500 [Amycolatopsis sp. CA-161197]|uniref:hypothetical protein n=1 Tax=Amycolatopsis sp. CA-161197 TaxID=3239922 RepID=UPI003D937695
MPDLVTGITPARRFRRSTGVAVACKLLRDRPVGGVAASVSAAIGRMREPVVSPTLEGEDIP